MVAIVFRYADEVIPSGVSDGRLPTEFEKYIYTPTWDNMLVLFERLAEGSIIEPDKREEFAPRRIFFRSPSERNFVLSFPTEGKQRIKRSSYYELKAVGGSDWEYRKLLESKLSVFEHFLGNGRTHDEVLDPDGRDPGAGLVEFVGPNRPISDLAEVAIIHLGQLTIEHSSSIRETRVGWGKP
jgi:hypothetical protein